MRSKLLRAPAQLNGDFRLYLSSFTYGFSGKCCPRVAVIFRIRMGESLSPRITPFLPLHNDQESVDTLVKFQAGSERYIQRRKRKDAFIRTHSHEQPSSRPQKSQPLEVYPDDHSRPLQDVKTRILGQVSGRTTPPVSLETPEPEKGPGLCSPTPDRSVAER